MTNKEFDATSFANFQFDFIAVIKWKNLTENHDHSPVVTEVFLISSWEV